MSFIIEDLPESIKAAKFGLMIRSVGPVFQKLVMNALLLCLLPAALGSAQQLSPKWEELTAEDFVKALQ